jgi:hypothetical protein
LQRTGAAQQGVRFEGRQLFGPNEVNSSEKEQDSHSEQANSKSN